MSMKKTSYHRWEVADYTLRAYGGKIKEYRHNMPLKDFLKIVKNIQNVCLREGMVSKLDILNMMNNTKLSRDRVFNRRSHEYKVKMAFDILLIEGIIKLKGKKMYHRKRGRIPFGYILVKNKKDIEIWLNNLNS